MGSVCGVAILIVVVIVGMIVYFVVRGIQRRKKAKSEGGAE
jgi:preprotein translocase subunit YajC